MHIAMLSTYFENAGDELIREGVQCIIRKVLHCEPRWRHISKSNPLSFVLPVSWYSHAPVQRMTPQQRRWINCLWKVLNRCWVLNWCDRIRNADLVVIAGTPLFYFVGERSFLDTEGQYSCNWPSEVFGQRLEPATSPDFIAIGVGSIYEGAPEVLLATHPQAADFLRRFLHRASLITTRDTATWRLLLAACPERSDIVLPSVCPSLWAQTLWDQTGSARPRSENRAALYSAIVLKAQIGI
jgi:hypothetical protein